MKTSLLLSALLLCSFWSLGQDERNITITSPSNGDRGIVINDIFHDTLPSTTTDWEDRLIEGRIGMGLGAINGAQSGGFQAEIELYSQLTDLIGVELYLSGITDQEDNYTGPTVANPTEEVFNSWNGTVLTTFTLSAQRKTKLHRVSWRYYTPFNLTYQKIGRTMTRVQYRHFARVGWNLQGGKILGYTAPYQNDERVAIWDDGYVGNLLLGYAWRLDRWLQVQPTNLTDSKNLSRSRTFYADLMMNVFHLTSADVYQRQMDGSYIYESDLNTGQLSFSALGMRLGYRGTRLFNSEGFGLYHRYEMGWRPGYNGNAIGLNTVAPGGKFYLTVAVGLQF